MFQTEQAQKIEPYQKWLRPLIIVLLILGIFFRLANLEQKPYWGDESLTSQRIAGYISTEFIDIIRESNVISVKEMEKYQRPNSDKDLFDAMEALATHAEHPPFYYLMARFWMQLFRDYVITPRGLSALISLLSFPCMYWLCLELFNSSIVGLVALAILTISPFHVIYAQEARQYSLWAVTILLSSWALLRAIRLNNKSNWFVYIGTLTLLLYTSLLSVMVVVGQCIYVAALQSFRFSKVFIAYLIASLMGFLLFLPWIFIIIDDSKGEVDKYASWTQKSVPLISLVQTWLLNLSRIFFDCNNSFSYSTLWFYLFILILVYYSIYFLCRHTPKRVWLLICILIAIPILFLVFPDLILGGQRSSNNRYLTPLFLGIQIAVAYLLATKITAISMQFWQQKLWQMATVILVSSGMISCVVFTQTDTWWNKYREYYHSKIAEIVNQADSPLVLASWYDIRTLSYSLDFHVALHDISLQKKVDFGNEVFDNIFVYKNKNALEYFLENNSNYHIENTYNWKRQITPVNTTSTMVWKLKKN